MEWINQEGKDFKGTYTIPKPKLVVDPLHLRFDEVEPGIIQTASFIIKNVGGPCPSDTELNVWIDNPNSWVRMVRSFSLTDSGDLPLQVEIEADGEEWDTKYSEIIRIKLGEEETQVKVELQTKPEPIRVRYTGQTTGPAYTYTPPLTAVVPHRRLPAWAKWIIGMLIAFPILFLVCGYVLGPVLGCLGEVSNNCRNIYTMDTETFGQIRLSFGQDPVWSPDGEKIVFSTPASVGYNKQSIFVINSDGSNRVKLANNVDGLYCSWSPDSKKIAVISGDLDKVYVINADGSNKIKVLPPTELNEYLYYICRPAWSPDGSKIAFYTDSNIGNPEIYVMNSDCNQLRMLAYGYDPIWSPDGSKIAFESTRDGNFEIYIMNADGSGQVNLTNNPADDGYPCFSPDGQKIVFRRIDVKSGIYNTKQLMICIIDFACSEPTFIGRGYFGGWFPDGKKFVFSAYEEDSYNYYIIDADDVNNRFEIVLTKDLSIDTEFISISPDGEKILFAQEGGIRWNNFGEIIRVAY